MANRKDIHINERDNNVFNIRQISCIKTNLKTHVKTMRVFYRNDKHKDLPNDSNEYRIICNEIITLYNLYKSFEHEMYNMSVHENVEHFRGCTKLLDEYVNRKELLYWLKLNIESNK